MSIINIIRGIATYIFFIALLFLIFNFLLSIFFTSKLIDLISIILSIITVLKTLRVNWGIVWIPLFFFWIINTV